MIYNIILLKPVCRSLQTAGRNYCSIVSGDVSTCSYQVTVHHLTSSRRRSAKQLFMGKAHKNCKMGKYSQIFCLHHITGTAFIIRLKLYVYIVEDTEPFQNIYSFIQLK